MGLNQLAVRIEQLEDSGRPRMHGVRSRACLLHDAKEFAARSLRAQSHCLGLRKTMPLTSCALRQHHMLGDILAFFLWKRCFALLRAC